jgi:hypothetical protein
VHERHRLVNKGVVAGVADRDSHVIERVFVGFAREEIDYSRRDFATVWCRRVVDDSMGARVASGVVRA